MGWRHVADGTVRSDGIVVLHPIAQSSASVSERCEECFVEQFVAQPTIETLDEGVLGGLSWRDVMPVHMGVLRPAQYCHAGQFGAVVADDRHWLAAPGNDGIEFPTDP